MNHVFFFLLTIASLSSSAQTLNKRVVPNNPGTYRTLPAVHAGAGQMKFTELIGRQALATNFLYLHAGEIPDRAGIGHHFHHTIEEMYVILDGEAEFTVNGRTSRIKGPAAVPCKRGDSHGIYNSSGKALRWLNFAVSTTKARGDAFDLGDNRVGAALDPIPQFVSARLQKENLRTGNPAYTGNGLLYRRLLEPDVFSTAWDHVDHLIIPAGSRASRKAEGMEEVFYVIRGQGTVSVQNDSAALKADDAFFASMGEAFTLTNKEKEDLEVLVVGVAASEQKDPARLRPPAQPKAIVLQMDFVVAKENAEAFEKMYSSVYVPAMTVQQGYLGSKMLRLYPEAAAKEIEAEPTTYNYQIQISFDTEAARRKWVASPQHQVAWPAASGLAKEYKWRGYDVMGDDNR
jgi:mannose-6-phosphate isomerase-like protein (cupin superfamily)/heme-degrading monooxygenase HmoA